MAKLYFKYGAMNCGKTTILLQTAYNYEEQGMNVLIAKPAIDTKGNKKIESRLGVNREVDYLIYENSDIYEELSLMTDALEVNCVLIDECQFLKRNQIDELYKFANKKDIPVICYGLRTDFLNNGFEGSSRLLELAQSIQEMKNVCKCGSKATCNIRLINGIPVFNGNQVTIDGSVDSVSYEAVCAKCFLKLKEKFS